MTHMANKKSKKASAPLPLDLVAYSRASITINKTRDLIFDQTSKTISEIKRGLPYSRFEKLRAKYNLPADKMAVIMGMPRSTLIRRKKIGVLDRVQSERVVRFDRLLTRATDVLEDRGAAFHWLNAPAKALGGETPINYADTEIGAREVEMLLGRLEYGVFT